MRMIDLQRRRVLSLALGANLALAGCTSLVSRPAPVKHTFLLDPKLPQAIAGTPKPVALRIGTINVAAPFRGKNFVYRQSELGFENDYYDEFFVPPAIMLADATAKALAAARIFQRVVPSGAAGNDGDFLLDGFVTALYGDVRHGQRAAAQVTITFYLTPMSALGGNPVWTHDYSERVDLTGTTAEALAAAMNAAVSAVLHDVARDLAATELSKGT